jgi:predicted naringenin-chalcone synthase
MVEQLPAASLLGIGTAVPETLLRQNEAAARLEQALRDTPDAARWAKRIFRQCGVETRYTCEPNLAEPPGVCRYLPGSPPSLIPTTSERMERFKQASVPLAIQAAQEAMKDSGVNPSSITHLITVSCTGMFLPGLDTAMVRGCGLQNDVQRIPLQYLGCAAGMTAIRYAKDMAEAKPYHKVLVVCVELCTLHVQPSADREDLFAAAFFGDGASACVIGRPGSCSRSQFILGSAQSALLPESTAGEMTWDVGNTGFRLYLSPRITELLRLHVPPLMERFWSESEVSRPEFWAIHPGGKGIVDAVQTAFGLSDQDTAESRSVLQRYGNMSSATILFVLKEIKKSLLASDSGRKRGLAMAFGPGMQAELLQMEYIPAVTEVSETEGKVDGTDAAIPAGG